MAPTCLNNTWLLQWPAHDINNSRGRSFDQTWLLEPTTFKRKQLPGLHIAYQIVAYAMANSRHKQLDGPKCGDQSSNKTLPMGPNTLNQKWPPWPEHGFTTRCFCIGQFRTQTTYNESEAGFILSIGPQISPHTLPRGGPSSKLNRILSILWS